MTSLFRYCSPQVLSVFMGEGMSKIKRKESEEGVRGYKGRIAFVKLYTNSDCRVTYDW